MCLNETCSIVQAGKHLSDVFPINNGLIQRDALMPLLLNFALEQWWANFFRSGQKKKKKKEEEEEKEKEKKILAGHNDLL